MNTRYQSKLFSQRIQTTGNSVILLQCLFSKIESSFSGGAISINSFRFSSLETSSCIFDRCSALSQISDIILEGGAIKVTATTGIWINKTCFCKCHSNVGDAISYNCNNTEFSNIFFDVGKVEKNYINPAINSDLILCNISNFNTMQYMSTDPSYFYCYINHLDVQPLCNKYNYFTYFDNCRIIYFESILISNCIFKDTILIKISNYTNITYTTTNNNSYPDDRVTFATNLPDPIQIDACELLTFSDDYVNQTINNSITYMYIKQTVDIVNCKFYNISVLNDEGSAIMILRPSLYFNDYFPSIKIEDIYFLKCQSQKSPGCIMVNYENSKIDINRICAIYCFGYSSQVCEIKSTQNTYFNKSTTSSNYDLANYDTNYVYKFYGSEVNRYITGINTSNYIIIYSNFYLAHSQMSFCQEQNIITGSYIDYQVVNVSYSNYINITEDILFYNIIEKSHESVVYFEKCSFINCSLVKFYKDAIDKKNITLINCNFNSVNDLRKHFLPVCELPPTKGPTKLHIILLATLLPIAMIAGITSLSFFILVRLKQRKIEQRHELERELDLNFG